MSVDRCGTFVPTSRMGTPTCPMGSEMGHVSDPFLVRAGFQGLAEGAAEVVAALLAAVAMSSKVPSASGSSVPPAWA